MCLSVTFVAVAWCPLAVVAQVPATEPAASASSADDPFLSRPMPLNRLTGRIVGTDGRGLLDAMVGAAAGCGSRLLQGTKIVTTDKGGKFTIDHLPDGKVELRATCRDFRFARYVVISNANDFTGVLRRETEPSVVRAWATDADGKAVADIPLLFFGRGENRINGNPTTVVTDAAGRAELVRTPAVAADEDVIVMCDREGHDLAFGREVFRREDAETSLVLRPTTAPWRGKVVNSSGKPIAHASITVSSLDRCDGDVADLVSLYLFSDSSIGRYLTAETDGEGVFELPRIPKDGRLGISIVAAGFEVLRPKLEPSTLAKTSEYRFVLRPGIAMSGRVEVEDGSPVVGDGKAEVELALPDGEWVASCLINADGTFATDRVPAGTYLMTFYGREMPNRRYVTPKPVKVTLVDGEAADITVRVEEGLPVCGRVVGFKVGPKGLLPAVTLWAAPNKQIAACEVIKPDGTFEIYLKREGRYVLEYREGEAPAYRTLDVRKRHPIKDLVIDVSGNSGANEAGRKK